MKITLIGMPGVGKTFLGKKLSDYLGSDFIDGDDLIEKEYNMTLPEIIDKYSDKGFKEIEEKVLLNNLKNNFSGNFVFAAGGSVIYSEKLMNYLKSISVIVFLDDDFKNIKKRLKLNYRRIIGLKENNLEKLYKERLLFYNKFADVIVNCKDKNENNLIKEITIKIKNE